MDGERVMLRTARLRDRARLCVGMLVEATQADWEGLRLALKHGRRGALRGIGVQRSMR